MHYTDFIPLPLDGEKRNKIIGLVESLDDSLPGQMIVTDALQITTDNPRMAEMLEAIFHPTLSEPTKSVLS